MLGRETAEAGHVAGTYRDDTGDLLITQIQLGVRAPADSRTDGSVAINRMTGNTGTLVEIWSDEILVRPASTERNQQNNRYEVPPHGPAI